MKELKETSSKYVLQIRSDYSISHWNLEPNERCYKSQAGEIKITPTLLINLTPEGSVVSSLYSDPEPPVWKY
jgi:hypothetical protein